MRYIYDIKFGMLQVRENDISLRKNSLVMLRTLEETSPFTLPASDAWSQDINAAYNPILLHNAFISGLNSLFATDAGLLVCAA